SEISRVLTASASGLLAARPSRVAWSGSRMGSTTCKGVARAGPKAVLWPSVGKDSTVRGLTKKYWQTRARIPRRIFAHAERILGMPNHEDRRVNSFLSA